MDYCGSRVRAMRAVRVRSCLRHLRGVHRVAVSRGCGRRAVDPKIEEQEDDMYRLTSMLACVALVVLGFGLLAAGSAGAATNNPQFSLCVEKAEGKFAAGCEKAGSGFETELLKEGSTKEITASASGTPKLVVDGVTITAKALKVAKGAKVIGSTAPNPGTSEQKIEFEEPAVEGNPECKIEQGKKVVSVLSTTLLKGTLVYLTKASAEEEKGTTGTLVAPASGSTFLEVELVGKCPVEGSQKVTGSLVLENVDGNKYQEKHELKGPASVITRYFVNEGGKTVEKSSELKDGGGKAEFIIILFIIVVLVLIALSAN
jgi:hypothetical protein